MLLLGFDQLENKVIARDRIRPGFQRLKDDFVGAVDFSADAAQHVDFHAQGFSEFFAELVQLRSCECDLFQFGRHYIEVDRIAFIDGPKERLGVFDQHFDD